MRLLFLLLCLPALALAAPVDKSINYTGTLDNNGQPYTGDAQMSFRICTDVAVEEGCQALGDPRLVKVAGGKFSVTLGGDEAFAALMAQDVQYFLEISVGDPGAVELTRLGSRTPLRPRGQSLWSLRAATAGHADTAAHADTAGRADTAGTADVALTGPNGQDLGQMVPVHGGCVGFPLQIGNIGRGGLRIAYIGVGEVRLHPFNFDPARHMAMVTSLTDGAQAYILPSTPGQASGAFHVHTRNSAGARSNDVSACWVIYDIRG